MGNLTVLRLQFNLPMLLRGPGQRSVCFYVALHCVAMCAISDAKSGSSFALFCLHIRCAKGTQLGMTVICPWGSLGGFYLFVPIVGTTTCFQHGVMCITHGPQATVSSRKLWGLLHMVTTFVSSPTIGMVNLSQTTKCRFGGYKSYRVAHRLHVRYGVPPLQPLLLVLVLVLVLAPPCHPNPNHNLKTSLTPNLSRTPN